MNIMMKMCTAGDYDDEDSYDEMDNMWRGGGGGGGGDMIVAECIMHRK